MIGEGLARGTLAREGGDRCRLRCRSLGGDLVLGSGSLQFREFQLHLIEEACRALRARPVNLALELRDLKLLVDDQRRVLGGLGACQSQLGLQRLDIVGLRIH